MVGNVFEWTNDWYHPGYYVFGPDVNPAGPDSTGVKAVRGGSYAVDASHVRPTYRARDAPNFKGPDVGFRCAGSANLGMGTMLRRETWGAIKNSSRLWLKGGNDE